jgi:hypothetical protein
LRSTRGRTGATVPSNVSGATAHVPDAAPVEPGAAAASREPSEEHRWGPVRRGAGRARPWRPAYPAPQRTCPTPHQPSQVPPPLQRSRPKRTGGVPFDEGPGRRDHAVQRIPCHSALARRRTSRARCRRFTGAVRIGQRALVACQEVESTPTAIWTSGFAESLPVQSVRFMRGEGRPH